MNTPPQAAMLGPKPKVADIEPSSSGAKAEMPRPTLKQKPAPVARSWVGNSSAKYEPISPAKAMKKANTGPSHSSSR